MSGVIVAALLAPVILAQAVCADPSTARGMRDIDHGVPSCESPAAKAKPRPITAGERAKVINDFDKLLKDGPTARWRFEPVRGSTICGFVNAKNSFGAYSGWTAFIADTQTTDINTYDGSRLWLFETICHGAAVPKD